MTSLDTRAHEVTSSPTHQITSSLGVLAVFTAILAALAGTLRPDAFFVGDQGIKLTATLNALHHPTAPLDIPLPTIAGEPAPHVEPFFAVHGDHAHALTSEAFPLLTAPLLAAFGVRGLYVLPALGFVATLAACAWLATVLDDRRSAALVALVAALGTPFLFYGLEFWEHMPALALGVSGVALLLDRAARSGGARPSDGAALAAGLLMGSAAVLRPEAACFVAAALAASRTVVHRPAWRSIGVAATGVLAALVPTTIYSARHFGSIVPVHVSTNAGLLGAGWWAERLALATTWLTASPWTLDGPVPGGSFWSAAPVVLVAALSLVRSRERRDRAALWLMFAITVVLVVATAPNSGGSQWGPRYLLFAYVPLAILGADCVQALPPRRSAVAMMAALAALSLWVQRAAYRELRGTKSTYGQIVDLVERTAPPGGTVVSDLWWLDQLAARALDGRTFLFVDRPQVGLDIVRRLNDHRVPSVTVVRSREESPGVDAWSSGTCYVEEAREEIAVRGLVVIRLRHTCR